MTSQTKIETDEEIDIRLLGKDFNIRRDNGGVKKLCVFKYSVQEDKKHSAERVHFNMWNMTTKDYQAALCRGDSINIGIMKNDAVKTVKLHVLHDQIGRASCKT